MVEVWSEPPVRQYPPRPVDRASLPFWRFFLRSVFPPRSSPPRRHTRVFLFSERASADGSRQEGRSLSGWLNPASRHGGEKFSLEVLDECCIERKSTLTRRSTCWILALPY